MPDPETPETPEPGTSEMPPETPETPSTPPPGPRLLGDEGYARLLELLAAPPVHLPGLPPPASAGVPTDLREWLTAFKEPLVYMTVDAAMSAAQAKLQGYSRGRLKELYAQMSPAQIQAVMEGNVAVLKKHADQRVNEAAMLTSLGDRITSASASFLLSALAAL